MNSPMPSPKDFVAGWGQNDPLIQFPRELLERLTLSDEDKEFLAEAGLPASAAPFLSFSAPKSGELPTVAGQWGQPDAFRRYRIIGSDGSGNPIAVDEAGDGEVVCLDHDDKFARTLINTTVRQLAESLLAYRDTIREMAAKPRKGAAEGVVIPPQARKQLHQRLKKIDPAAMKPGCFWPEETGTSDATADYPAQVLSELTSPDASVRLKASKHLESELRKAATAQRKELFGNESATSALLMALDDPDARVVHNAVVALAQITRSYFKDDRIYARMLPLAHSKHPLTARWAIEALIHLREEASLDDVLPLCTDPSQEARAMVLNHLYSWLMAKRKADTAPIRSENRERMREAALRALNDVDATARGNAASLLREVGDATVLPALRQLLKKEPHWLTKQSISSAIEALERPEGKSKK